MRTLDSETNPYSESVSNLEPVQEDSIVAPPSNSSPHKRASLQHNPHSLTPKKKTSMFRNKAHSSSLLAPSASGSLKNTSASSIANGRTTGHSTHTSPGHSLHSPGHSSHTSHHSSNSSASGASRLRTVSVGSKPTATLSTPRRPSSGHAHRDKDTFH